MGDQSISNRLHRAGAIDFNVTFATRQASILRDTKNRSGKRLYIRASDDDSLSVCESEPIYSSKRHKGGNQASSNTARDPLACISSLNGLALPNDILSGSCIDDVKKHEALRDHFFNNYHYQGIAVSKWSYGSIGKQQEQFVATAGGLNTIYCDVACQAGDTIVVDLPLPTDPSHASQVDHYDPSNGNLGNQHQWGFAKCTVKRGTPSEKQTLVVRPMPSMPDKTHSKYNEIKRLRQNFIARGQVLGKCVSGARKGERIDIVVAANAINGCINMSDFCNT